MRQDHFDYVVIGGGSAGCLVSSRIAMNTSGRILVLEAGPQLSVTPNSLRYITRVSAKYDWGFQSEPTRNTNYRKISLLRGKLLGGSSMLNMGILATPPAVDFEQWPSSSDYNWSWASVEPVFERLISSHRVPSFSWPEDKWVPVQRSFFESASVNGYAQLPPVTGDDSCGVGPCALTTRGSVRWNCASAFLEPLLHAQRYNLTLKAGVTVDKLIIENGVAKGVKYIDSSLRIGTAWAERGIILSAGVFGTPAILLRSGIGPAREIERHGIHVCADLPSVGTHLRDHPIVVLRYRLASSVAGINDPLFQVLLRAGSDVSENVFDLHILPRSSSMRTPGLSKGEFAFMLIIGLMNPVSEGLVQLRSASPFHAPSIDPGFLNEPYDLNRLVTGISLAEQIVNTEPLKGLLNGRIIAQHVQESLSQKINGISLGQLVNTYHHGFGTCRMGLTGDSDSVVDEVGRVHCVEGLRVIDSSVIPFNVRANTQFLTLMIAERLSDAFLES